MNRECEQQVFLYPRMRIFNLQLGRLCIIIGLHSPWSLGGAQRSSSTAPEHTVALSLMDPFRAYTVVDAHRSHSQRFPKVLAQAIGL